MHKTDGHSSGYIILPFTHMPSPCTTICSCLMDRYDR